MTSSARGADYRPDIDGLRGCAVLAVMGFHFRLLGLPGGFAGVDVFFVVSGYLIAEIIQREIASGTFDIFRFFKRRVRRVAPALLATLGLTLLAGYLLMPPAGLMELAREAVASLAMVPNVLFWHEASGGYFAALKRSPPALLHLWSLGVEEQFYLVFPLFLMIAGRFRLTRPAIIAVVFVSFALCALVASRAPAAAFYLLPLRAWELAAGALLSAGAVQIPQHWRAETSLLGLALVTTAFVLLDESSPILSLLLLAPVVGTALLIGSGPAAPANRLIALPALVWIGRISYSLYLLHWPILVFLLAPQSVDRLSPALTLAAIAAAIALGAISYRLIEQPLRRPAVRFRNVAIISVVGAGLVVMLSFVPLLTAGLPGRFSPEALAMAAYSRDYSPLARRCMGVPLDRIERECLIGKGPPTAVVWGDSHAAADSAGIADGLGQPTVLAAMGGCAPLLRPPSDRLPDRCTQRNRALIDWVQARPAIKTVVLAANWSARRAEGNRLWTSVAASVAALSGRTVVILAGTPDPQVDVPNVSAMRFHLGLSPLRWPCPPATVLLRGAITVDLSHAFCAYPQPWQLFSDTNHPSLTANRAVIAPALRQALRTIRVERSRKIE